MHSSPPAAVELYWIPLGAGGHYVRLNGRIFEALAATWEHRRRCDLYHTALVVRLDGDGYAIELAPSPDADLGSRGVVATGAVGSRHAGRFRLFRYEVRCCRGGSIPDLAEAVGGPCRLTTDPVVVRRLLAAVAAVPTPVWGRDELGTGDMWNCNSVIAWLIASAGLPAEGLRPPPRGRAPGWHAGLEAARRGAGHQERSVAPRARPGAFTRLARLLLLTVLFVVALSSTRSAVDRTVGGPRLGRRRHQPRGRVGDGHRRGRVARRDRRDPPSGRPMGAGACDERAGHDRDGPGHRLRLPRAPGAHERFFTLSRA